MKNILITLLVLISVVSVSCKKYFGEDGDINKDPSAPLEVIPSVILPGIQANMSYSFGGDASRFATILSQHIQGISRQWAVLETYNFVGEDVNTLYGYNIYANILQELKRLQEQSSRDGLNHYKGVAKILEAYTLLFVADFWDSSPYSEAFQGVDNLQPAYDSQEQLYSVVFSLLQTGRQDLSLDGGALVPGGDDLIYGGDISSWIGLSHFIEARANLRLAKTNSAKYQDALTATQSGLVSDMVYSYSGGTFAHPMHQFNVQRGDCALGTKISELLNTLSDPRKPLYDQPLDESNTYITDDFPHKMATMVEQKFIEAECVFQISGAVAAHPIYLEAIDMALTAEGIDAGSIATYVGQASVDPGAASLTIEHIITQKYLALFLDYETYTDWRRTGFPALTPNNGTAIPRRFPVSQKELNLNGANAPQTTIYQSVSWDQ